MSRKKTVEKSLSPTEIGKQHVSTNVMWMFGSVFGQTKLKKRQGDLYTFSLGKSIFLLFLSFFLCSSAQTFSIKRTSTTMTTTTNRKLITPNDKWFNYLLHKPSVLFLIRDQNTFETTGTLVVENCFSAYAFVLCVCCVFVSSIWSSKIIQRRIQLQ